MHLPGKLFSNTKRLNKVTVFIDIIFLQIIKQTSSLSNKFQQTLTGVMIFFVGFEMIGQILNSISD